MNLHFCNVCLSCLDFNGQINHDASKPHWVQMLEQILESKWRQYVNGWGGVAGSEFTCRTHQPEDQKPWMVSQPLDNLHDLVLL